jgi:hypothetical protein
MGQLEARRETLERQKTIRMGRAFSKFVNVDVPDSSEDELETRDVSPQTNPKQPSHDSLLAPSIHSVSQDPAVTENVMSSPSRLQENEDRVYQARKRVFARGATLIRNALDVEGW